MAAVSTGIAPRELMDDSAMLATILKIIQDQQK